MNSANVNSLYLTSRCACGRQRKLRPSLRVQNYAGSFRLPARLLNPDVLEEIIRQTLQMYPYTRPSLRAVSTFFKNIVDREPLPQVYIPELNDFTDIRRVSVRKIMRLKGKNSGGIVRLREIINSVQWVSAWLSFIAAGYGWFFITHIYWKQKTQH